MVSMIRSRGTGLEDLNEQQRAFAVEWVKSRSPRKALEAGGYSLAGEHTGSARRVRSLCLEYIAQLEASIRRSALVSVSSIQTSIAVMTDITFKNFIVSDPETGASRPKKMSEITDEEASAIQEFELNYILDWDWKPDPSKPNETCPMIAVLGEVKLIDKLKAKQMLGKTIGMFANTPLLPAGSKVGDSVGHAMLSKLPTADLMLLESMMRKAADLVSKARDTHAIPVDSEVLVAGGKSILRAGSADSALTAEPPAPRQPSTDKETE